MRVLFTGMFHRDQQFGLVTLKFDYALALADTLAARGSELEIVHASDFTRFTDGEFQPYAKQRRWFDLRGSKNPETQLFQDIADGRFDVVLCWNPYTELHQKLKEVCRTSNIPWLCIEGGVIPGTIEFDDIGQQAESYPVRNSSEFQQLPVNAQFRDEHVIPYLDYLKDNRVSRRTSTPLADDSAVKIRSDRPRVFCAGTNQTWGGFYPTSTPYGQAHSPFYSSNADLVAALIDVAIEQDFDIVFKCHPDCSGCVTQTHERLHVVTEGDIYDCIEAADVTVAIATSVPALAALTGKPCVLAGRNGLTSMGVCYEMHARDDLPNQIRQALQAGFTDSQRSAFEDYCVRSLQHYTFAYSEAAAGIIGRYTDDAADMITNYSQNRSRAPSVCSSK